ncbi:MAG: hypothetical protein K0Q43_26 [Ramlibacter sp.]|jgi:hypothetical protein|nr:hypothetical protein [Ramlibacter sp.]
MFDAEHLKAPQNRFMPVDIIHSATRNTNEWLAREDARLLDCTVGLQYLSAQDLGDEMSRDPLLVLRRILESEIPAMVGFDVPPGSEEEAEFLGLGLSGAPLPLILRWCTATADQDDRPEWDELAMYMTEDLRSTTELVRQTGLWLTSAGQVDSLKFLAAQPVDLVRAAVQKVLDHVDVPTPWVIENELRGNGRSEPPVDWHAVCATAARRRGRIRYGGKKRRPAGKRRSAETLPRARRRSNARR